MEHSIYYNTSMSASLLHLANIGLDNLLTRSGLTRSEVSLNFWHRNLAFKF
jgi:hypothetical protein